MFELRACIQIVFSWTSTEKKNNLLESAKNNKTIFFVLYKPDTKISQFFFSLAQDIGAAKRLSKHDCSQLPMEARTDAHAPTAKQRIAP